MPITPQQVTATIIAASPSLKGPTWVSMCVAIGQAVVTWSQIPGNVVIVGSTSGALGAGTVNGKFFLPFPSAPMVGSLSANAINGTTSPQAGVAIAMGIGAAYTSFAGYTGLSTGAIGADTSKVVFANGATLGVLLVSSFSANGIVGPTAGQMAVALSVGIALGFTTGYGVGVSVGAGGPMVGTGVSNSKII
jgi:hypothetical protein